METESVWDYPRPPKLEKTKNLIVVEFGGIIVETRDAYRVLETSHPLPITFRAKISVRRL